MSDKNTRTPSSENASEPIVPFKDELDKLDVRITAVESKDGLYKRLVSAEKRLLDLESIEVKEIKDEIKKIKKELDPEFHISEGFWSWESVELQITKKVIGRTFILAFFLLATWAFLYAFFSKEPRVTGEYLSYAFPILAAISAGLTVYLEHMRGRLFMASVYLLLLGLDAFMAIHDKSYVFVAIINFCVAVVITAWIAFNGFNHANAASRALEGRASKVSTWFKAFLPYLVTVMILVFLMQLLLALYAVNYNCMLPFDPHKKVEAASQVQKLPSQCAKIGPSLPEILWPYGLLFNISGEE